MEVIPISRTPLSTGCILRLNSNEEITVHLAVWANTYMVHYPSPYPTIMSETYIDNWIVKVHNSGVYMHLLKDDNFKNVVYWL